MIGAAEAIIFPFLPFCLYLTIARALLFPFFIFKVSSILFSLIRLT